MRKILRTALRTGRAWLAVHHFRLEMSLLRFRRAWRYAFGGLSADDAQRMMLECREPAGWHPLLTLTVEDTLEQAQDTLLDHPDLPRLIAASCSRVGDKWESYGDELYEARRWAIDLAKSYAAQDGIVLFTSDGEIANPTEEDER
jgi:hypothetical protein